MNNAVPNQVLQAYYDNATKLLQVNGQDFVGAVTYGMGAIGQQSPRTAHSYLPEFEAKLAANECERLAVEEFATELSSFFVQQWQAANMPAEGPPMVFLVGGYDANDPYGKVFQFSIPVSPKPREVHAGSNQFGMVWGGQKEFIDRIISGFDGRLPLVAQEILKLTDDQRNELETKLKGRLEPSIPYDFLPLQDSVDLSILLIRTTISVQNWIAGTRGVGGPIDVAIITRTKGFEAIQYKRISGERLEG